MRSLLLLLLFVLPGCASTFMTAELYDQTCSEAADCVAVTEGDACGLCGGGCPNAAINAKAQAQYDADKRAIACVRLGPTPAIACAACREPSVFCMNGKCALGR